jgi:hypothetical protein
MSNGNKSFTYVQNVTSVDVQEVNVGQVTASTVDASNVLIIPVLSAAPIAGVHPGTEGQVVLDASGPSIYVYVNGAWTVVV